ncbi:hypothetical protein pneo_cds_947 [Pandoravirus neocaledonia]|uniref:Uncharacterized protein n=1 Tax=Pandoravirus neocaledonia TaxID=2107708 RepID=A0A2U7UDM9_9VIRU|nr:hypothetical protein pneo_cds_947 [Pandoravirus neocaledonia]AVK76554.1 hypothetical protein pneo_cds_947 [Pandoravirus neocaledonia]
MPSKRPSAPAEKGVGADDFWLPRRNTAPLWAATQGTPRDLPFFQQTQAGKKTRPQTFLEVTTNAGEWLAISRLAG